MTIRAFFEAVSKLKEEYRFRVYPNYHILSSATAIGDPIFAVAFEITGKMPMSHEGALRALRIPRTLRKDLIKALYSHSASFRHEFLQALDIFEYEPVCPPEL